MLSLKKILAIFCSMILVLQLATCDMIQHCLNLFAWHMQSVISRHMAYHRKPEIEPDNRLVQANRDSAKSSPVVLR